jgi:hypothetical protein
MGPNVEFVNPLRRAGCMIDRMGLTLFRLRRECAPCATYLTTPFSCATREEALFMKLFRSISVVLSIALVVLSVSYFTSLFAQDEPPPPPQATSAEPEEVKPIPDDAVEALTRGPIHEGFATPLTNDVPESIVVRKAPPEPIEEVPPEVKPEGDNVAWIPGYWAWNDEDERFIWISGFWRDVPPGRVWVSGYWTDADGGSQWVPGFWSSASQKEVEYLPEPPQSIEEGPSVEAPSADHFWVPGIWQWQQQHYVWRTGYWARRTSPDWIWVPAHYVWCPSGYVYIDGYYDYPEVRRGTLFAPVHFTQAVWERPYYFTPTICWSTHVLTHHLWVRPRYYHYYYGDYYADRYVDWGIRPWYLSFAFGNFSHDPLYSYHRWRHHHDHHDHDWDRHVRDRHDYYRRNEDFRPPRTYRDQIRYANRVEDRRALRESVVAAPVTQIVNNNINITNNPTINNIVRENFRDADRLTRIDQTRRRQAARQAEQMRNVVQERRRLETRDNAAQVERGAGEDAKKGGPVARGGRPAPRTLNMANVAQAIGDPAGVDRRGRGRDRDLRDSVGPDVGRAAGPGAKGRDVTGAERARGGEVNEAIRDAAKTRDVRDGITDVERDRGSRDIVRDATPPTEKGRKVSDAIRDSAKARDLPGAAGDVEKGRSARDAARETARDAAKAREAAKARDLGSPPGISRPEIGGIDRTGPSSRGREPRENRETAPREERGKDRGPGRENRAERPGVTGSPAGPTAIGPGGPARQSIGDRDAQDREVGRRATREMIEGARLDSTPDARRIGGVNIPGTAGEGARRAVGDPSGITRQSREPAPLGAGARGPAPTGRDDARGRPIGTQVPRSVDGPGVTRQPRVPDAPRQIRPTAPSTRRAVETRRVEIPQPRQIETRRVEIPQPRATRTESPSVSRGPAAERSNRPPTAVQRGEGARARPRDNRD